VPDQLLPPVLAETQRVPGDAPMQLARALLALPPTPPLPDPLPEPPPVPVSYLDQLSEAINRDHLTVSEQRDLLGSIKQRLRDPDERDAGVALLHRLRHHAEINAWVAEEIDAELAKLGVAPGDGDASRRAASAAPPAEARPAATASAPPSRTQQPPPGSAPAGPAPYPPATAPGSSGYYRPPAPPPPQTWAPPPPPPRPPAPPPIRRKSNAGWWIAAIVGLVLLLGLGSCAALVLVDANGDAELAQLRDACDGGDMSACDELFRESPVDSDDEFFGASCGLRTDGAVGNQCEATFGPFVDD
jgi:hypothetical protein